jgi:hypothetical protein
MHICLLQCLQSKPTVGLFVFTSYHLAGPVVNNKK